MLSFPLTIFGSIFIVIANLPFLNLLMSDDKLAILKGALAPAAESSMLMMTVFVVMGIGYYLTSSYNIEGIFGSAIRVSAFFLVTPPQNLEAYQAGKELPNIITKQFIETYTVGLGGTGMTIAVVFALLFVVKSRQLKELGKLAGPSAIFNVNEPITFGLPIVMNPLVFVPWLLAPIVVVIFTYIMMAVGLAPIPTGVIVPWTVPVFFSGVLATNSVMGGVLQIINCFIVFIIWLPFLKVLDRKALEMETKPQEEDLDLEL